MPGGPNGQGVGIWPAFWMLGTNINQVGWPNCGEIDIMENKGSTPGEVQGTLHGPGYSGGSGITSYYDLPGGQNFYSSYHVFAADWGPNFVNFLVDGHIYAIALAGQSAQRDDVGVQPSVLPDPGRLRGRRVRRRAGAQLDLPADDAGRLRAGRRVSADRLAAARRCGHRFAGRRGLVEL